MNNNIYYIIGLLILFNIMNNDNNTNKFIFISSFIVGIIAFNITFFDNNDINNIVSTIIVFLYINIILSLLNYSYSNKK